MKERVILMAPSISLKEFTNRLDTLKTALLSMPEDLTLTPAFQDEQDKLSELLTYLPALPEQDQEEARLHIQIFSKQLSEKVVSLQERYEQLRKNIDGAQLRLKGMKAYAKGQIG